MTTLRDPQRNSVFQSLKHLFQTVGAPLPVRLHLQEKNQIPLMSGLGSSATALVAGLAGANALLGFPFSMDKLAQMALQLEGHPDNVLPALQGGIAVAAQSADGEWSYLTFSPRSDLVAVIALPDYALSTELARQALPASYERQAAIFNLQHAGLLVGALVSGKYALLGAAMRDQLHQPYRSVLLPGFSEAIAAALQAGAYGAALSGAGPAVIALCEPGLRARKVAEAMREAYSNLGIGVRLAVPIPLSAVGLSVERVPTR
ncbi:MAG: homoserine kinase [Firmicutes bacterium]|nr:homoserine kinase [Bacillota bacterium]